MGCQGSEVQILSRRPILLFSLLNYSINSTSGNLERNHAATTYFFDTMAAKFLLMDVQMSSCCGGGVSNTQAQMDSAQKRLLWTVLVLNGVMFFVEFIAGWIAESSGLIADSLDMLADTLVYAVSLYAVGKAIKYKANAAIFNGILQTALALLVLGDVAQRLIWGSEPNANMMLWIAGLALLVNVICFALLYSSRNGDINIRASWICSRNDMLMNAGVILSAWMVSVINKAWPDLLIATIIAIIVLRSALRIIKDAHAVKAGEKTDISTCCG